MKRVTWFLAIVSVLLGACTDNTPVSSVGQRQPEQESIQRIVVDSDADGAVTVTLPDGSVAHGWEEYARMVSQRPWDFAALEIQATILEPSLAPLEDGSASMPLGDIDFKVGKYYVRGSWETGFIGACIKRDVRHLGFMVSQQGVKQPIADLHIAAWTDQGRLCVGIYESGRTKFCVRICTPTFAQIRDGITQALVAAGIAYTTAYIIAYVIAPVAVVALAL